MFFRLLRGGNKSYSALLTDRHYPGSNTIATKTIAGVANSHHLINKIYWSYNADPTGGQIQIENGSGNIIFQQSITKSGPGALTFMPRRMDLNTAMIITLAAGGAGITGKLDFDYSTELLNS